MKLISATARGSFWRLIVAATSLIFASTTGCLRHRSVTNSGAYQLRKFSDVTVLTPPGLTRATGNTQDTVIVLEGKPGTQALAEGKPCVIDGPRFAFQPGTLSGRWRVTSPTPEAWNTPTIQALGEGEWLAFTNQITVLASRGCFPSGISSYIVQRRIVEAIPIPADKALRFYYSLTAAGFVDLQPGMQLRIETIEPMEIKSRKPVTRTVQLAVIGQTPTGVALEAPTKKRELKGSEGSLYRDLPLTTLQYPLLRLFLEQAATETAIARKAILLGARTSNVMDSETTALFQSKESRCPETGLAVVCTIFPESAVSLLTSVTVNGHIQFYAPGTTLSQVIDSVPEPRRAAALASVSLARSSDVGSVPILVPRSEDDLVNVLLINGDQIRWYNK